MTVKATDNDDGTNGKVLYHLQVSGECSHGRVSISFRARDNLNLGVL